MKRLARLTCLTGLVGVIAAGWMGSTSPATQAAAAAAQNGIEPVEPDMHEFMEHVFQPTFKRLRTAMAAEPADNAVWKAIKADSLILAEGGNLLLMRTPTDDAADWAKHSVHVRDFGSHLYRAAKTKDFPAARKGYESMVTNCNACHHQFAGGEHILKP